MSKPAGASEAVAERVLTILEDRGISVNLLAARTGIPRPTLDRHLKVTPWLLAAGEIEGIAAALDVRFEDLFIGAAA